MKIIDQQTEIKLHNYEEINEVINPNPKLINFASFIESLEIDKRKYILQPSTSKEVLNNGKKFLTSHFTLNKIPYKGTIRNKIDKYVLTYIPGIKIPLRVHNSFIRYIDPFELPVLFTSPSITECMVVENVTLIDTEEFIRNMKISYSQIILPEQITTITEDSYVHEITHTQLAHIKGIIKNYYNSEVLSIFLELLYVYESPKQEILLPLKNATRLIELYEQIYMLRKHHLEIESYEHEDLINSSKYTESIIKAYGLFTEYIYGSTTLKKYILNTIQHIFNGTLQLEELLDEFELTLDNVTEDNRLKKILTL